MTKKNIEKPLTCVVTYRGVNNFPIGLYEGKTRDVLVTGAVIPPHEFDVNRYGEVTKDYGGVNKVSGEAACAILQKATTGFESEICRVDELFVYVGAKGGAGAAFEYIKEHMQGNRSRNIGIVACDCDKEYKLTIASMIGAPITWSECGGRDTLERIVYRALNE